MDWKGKNLNPFYTQYINLKTKISNKIKEMSKTDKNEEQTPNEPKTEALNIADVSTSFICDLEPKITFINELWVGKVKIPVRTEFDFSGVHSLQHEKILEIAHKLYCVDKQVNGR